MTVKLTRKPRPNSLSGSTARWEYARSRGLKPPLSCVTHQRALIRWHNRGEIGVRDPLLPRRRANVIRNRVQRQVHDLARIRRDVSRRAVYEITMKHQKSARFTGRRDDSAGIDQLRDRILVQCPKWV